MLFLWVPLYNESFCPLINLKGDKIPSDIKEALEKLRNGSKFDDVAREFSEDKARQGTYLLAHTL